MQTFIAERRLGVSDRRIARGSADLRLSVRGVGERSVRRSALGKLRLNRQFWAAVFSPFRAASNGRRAGRCVVAPVACGPIDGGVSAFGWSGLGHHRHQREGRLLRSHLHAGHQKRTTNVAAVVVSDLECQGARVGVRACDRGQAVLGRELPKTVKAIEARNNAAGKEERSPGMHVPGERRGMAVT